jgi:hypothetical protein
MFTAVVNPRLVNALTLPLQRGGPLVASVVSPPVKDSNNRNGDPLEMKGGWKMAHL